MKNTCWRPFAYLVPDHLAAQDYLNRMAAKGWELDWIAWGYFARFKQTQRKDLSYFLDWGDPETDEQEDYLRLCEDAGWEPVIRQRYWNIYASRPGTDPSPIQTDPELEYQRFRKKVLRRMALIGGFVLLGLLPFIFLIRFSFPSFSALRWIRHWEEVLSEDLLSTVLLFLVPFWALCAIFYCAMLARRLLHWKRKGYSFHSKGILGSLLNLSIGFSLLLLLFTYIMDMLYNGVRSYYTELWNIPSTFVFVSSIFGYLQSRQAPKKRRPDAIIVFLLILASCTVLHFPAQAVLPHRIPEFPSHSENVWPPERTDTLLGSYMYFDGSYNDPGLGWQEYFGSVYAWATPGLAEYFVEAQGDHRVPVPGYENVWRFGRSTILLRGNAYILLYNYDAPEAVPVDEILAWLESWA